MSTATPGPSDYAPAESCARAASPPSWRELGFATVVALLLALSPVTGAARLAPSLLLGALGGAAVLVFRRRTDAIERLEPRARAPRIPVPCLASVAAFLVVSGPTLVWLYGEYTDSVWRNQHGLFVPFFMILAARSTLRRDPHPEREESSAWGFAFLLPAIALMLVDAGVGSQILSATGIVVALPGLSLLLLGPRRTLDLALPLALGVFLIPIPVHTGDPLGIASTTAIGSEWLTRALGFSVEREATSLLVRGVPFVVSQNCSGLATLHAATAFAVLLIGLGSRRRMTLLLAPFPLTCVFNSIRCTALIVAGTWSRDLMDTPLHGLSGLAVFWSVIGTLWLLADRRAVRERLA